MCRKNPNSAEKVEELSDKLNVKIESLLSLGFTWNCCLGKFGCEFGAWVNPMRNGKNWVNGIMRRFSDGSKMALGNLGLFIPQVEVQKVVYLPEGASDTATLLTMGFYAIGRPSCNFGGQMIREFVQLNKISRAVIVADNDGIKFGGRRPGLDGAKKLKSELGIPSVIWMPPNPCKDVRELAKKIGYESAKRLIESDLTHKIWTRV